MKRVMIIALGIIGLCGAIFAWMPKANCAWCPTYRCYAPCGMGCLCVTVGGEIGGTCVSVQAVPAFLARGYEVVP